MASRADWPAEANAVATAVDGTAAAVPWPARTRQRRRHLMRLVDPRRMTEEEIAAELEALLEAEERTRFDWARWARPEQIQPEQYMIWLILSGRGWGKTRTGAETVRIWASKPNQRIAVVAKSHREVQAICVEAPRAGLLACIPPDEVRQYRRTTGDVKILLRNGTTISMFSAEDPDVFRGYAFDGVWCDEYAAWPRRVAQGVMDMLWFCLREAADPRVIVTTTPKALPHVKALVKRAETDTAVQLTSGHTLDNRKNLSEAAIAELEASYAGTRLGRQELAGELLEDVEGALWTPPMFEWDGFRTALPDVPELTRRVLALDPAVTSSETSDQYGLAIAGSARVGAGQLPGVAGRIEVFGLHTEAFRATPEKAMARVAERYHSYECDYVVVEVNNGGDYIPALMATVDETVPVRKIHARKGKLLRAEPVSILYEQHRAHHVGPPARWASLESVMTTYTGDPSEDSPDELDAHVYAVLELAGPKNRPATTGSAAAVDKRQVGAPGAGGRMIIRTPPSAYR